MRKLTIVQLVPALASGGAERSTLEISAALVRAGHRSIVVSAGGRLVEPLVRAGGEHRELPLASKSLFVVRHVPTLRRWLREWRADVVHARSRLPAWIALLALRGLEPRPHFVTTVHGLNSPGRYSAVMTRGERAICVSECVRHYLLRHYPEVPPERLVTIPRGVEPGEFPHGYQPDAAWRERFARELPQLAGVPLLVLAARGTRLKGHDDAIRALTRLREVHGIEAGLLLLGAREPGREDYVAGLEALARVLGVAARVAIVAPRSDVRDYYAVAAAVLQTSQRPESFGRVVIEALSLGVPLVGYAHGGVGELLAELFPAGAVAPGNVEALASAIAAVVRERPTIAPLQRYRLADMQDATLALYRELAA